MAQAYGSPVTQLHVRPSVIFFVCTITSDPVDGLKKKILLIKDTVHELNNPPDGYRGIRIVVLASRSAVFIQVMGGP